MSSGKCACDSPWTGGSSQPGVLPDCSLLSFLPSPVSECGPGCVFHGVDKNWTSWGVSVSAAAATGGFVGYAAEMAFECSLSAWTKGSQVVRVVGSTPLGPFNRTDIIVPAWSHNPEAIHTSDGKTIIFTLGDGWEQNGQPDNCETGQKYPSHRGNVGNCTPVTEPSNCNPGPCLACNVTLHVGDSDETPGPWESFSTQIIGLSSSDNLNNWNPAPFILPNGSIALMIHTDDNQGWSGEVIAIASTWKGPYIVTVSDNAVNNLPNKQEDPFLWVDRRGYWHVLYHLMFDPDPKEPCGLNSGGHSFSIDGTSWSPIFHAYNTTIQLEDGSSYTFSRRERPKLLFNTQGIPTHLYNGVISADYGVYTLVAPLKL